MWEIFSTADSNNDEKIDYLEIKEKVEILNWHSTFLKFHFNFKKYILFRYVAEDQLLMIDK